MQRYLVLIYEIVLFEVKFFAVTYDLRQPDRKYDELYNSIKSIAGEGNWQHPMESYWVIAFSELSYYNAENLYQEFRKQIDDNDSLIVEKIDVADQQGWMPKSFWNWINEKRERL